MQKVFYDPTTNTEVVDVSGRLTETQIKQRYGGSSYEQVEYDPKVESIEYADGKLRAFNIKQREDEKLKITDPIELFKLKHKFTDKDIQILKRLLNDSKLAEEKI